MMGTQEVRDTVTGLPDGFADVVLSNCVISLCPDKHAAYAEAFRILRLGGRIAISDIILAGPIQPELAARFQATWVGCLGGAIPVTDYLTTVRAAGFTDPDMVARTPLKAPELEAMARCPGEDYTPAPAPGRHRRRTGAGRQHQVHRHQAHYPVIPTNAPWWSDGHQPQQERKGAS